MLCKLHFNATLQPLETRIKNCVIIQKAGMTSVIPAFCIHWGEARKFIATRMSAAGEGLTEPNIYLRLAAQMQTSLATWSKNILPPLPENHLTA